MIGLDVRTYAGREFYTRQTDVGRVLGTSARMVQKYVRTGRLPSYTLPSGRKIYAVEDVEAFMIPIASSPRKVLIEAGA